jgi:hypothetical protein
MMILGKFRPLINLTGFQFIIIPATLLFGTFGHHISHPVTDKGRHRLVCPLTSLPRRTLNQSDRLPACPDGLRRLQRDTIKLGATIL